MYIYKEDSYDDHDAPHRVPLRLVCACAFKGTPAHLSSSRFLPLSFPATSQLMVPSFLLVWFVFPAVNLHTYMLYILKKAGRTQRS
jgi:hypothetical protein